MLRLFAKRGVRLAPLPVVHQPPLRRTVITGDVNDSPELGADQNKEVSGNTKPNQQWSHGNENRLWDRVDKLDDRFAGLSKGFGEIKTEIADLKAEIKPMVWQVRVLLEGASLVVVFLVKTYLDEHNISVFRSG
ncbi:hypothetical protein BDD12DRAFT_894168 [Trichophaea hybrida]|nr:hypothetical protein BDD12DRAFT_894168 [Trichophaea hybrida]